MVDAAEHLDLIGPVVGQLTRALPWVDVEDIEAAVALALVQLARSWDPQRGIRFAQYFNTLGWKWAREELRRQRILIHRNCRLRRRHPQHPSSRALEYAEDGQAETDLARLRTRRQNARIQDAARRVLLHLQPRNVGLFRDFYLRRVDQKTLARRLGMSWDALRVRFTRARGRARKALRLRSQP